MKKNQKSREKRKDKEQKIKKKNKALYYTQLFEYQITIKEGTIVNVLLKLKISLITNKTKNLIHVSDEFKP